MFLKCFVSLLLIGVVFGRKSPRGETIIANLDSPYLFSQNALEDAILDVPGLIGKYGYPVEVHNVITADGYILETHRIPYGRDRNNRPGSRPVVFLMHGLLSSSADYLVQGPGKALGYILAEEGFDVWLGNARGNYYSRRHVSLNPDSNMAFWRFSWDEIGNYDLPAFIDYILNVTRQQKLHYIGHSQGGTTFLVLTSMKPEYNDKILSFQGLAPASFFDYNESPMFTQLAPFEKVLETLAFSLRLAEIGGSECKTVLDQTIVGDLLQSLICVSASADPLRYSEDLSLVVSAHAPAGASVRQLSHYGQCIRYKSFRRYNYDAITNLRTYGSVSPPDYDVSKVTAPTYLYYGLSDVEVNYKDVQTLASRIGNLVELVENEDPEFDHVDFIWNASAKELLYNKVIRAMKSRRH